MVICHDFWQLSSFMAAKAGSIKLSAQTEGDLETHGKSEINVIQWKIETKVGFLDSYTKREIQDLIQRDTERCCVSLLSTAND